MTAFKRFTLNLEPNKDPERYLTLAGYNFNNGQYEPFDTAPPLPDDQRFLMASGPFELPADSSVFFVFAIMFTNWKWHTVARPDSALALIDGYAQWWYDMYWCLYTGAAEHHEKHELTNDVQIIPSPMRKTGLVRFNLQYPRHVTVKVYDMAGRFVKRLYCGIGNAGLNEIRLDSAILPAGIYFVQVTAGSEKRVQRLTVVQ
jgi:hypothetical protein